MVTFSKKMQIAGFYHKLETRAPQSYRNFNTWLGDPVRAMQAGVILEQIRADKLLDNVTITGNYLMDGLNQIQVLSYPLSAPPDRPP
jgi:4-aminobutyrate aminotransferase/(S)-3-amino-2-methylpropionate transaminase